MTELLRKIENYSKQYERNRNGSNNDAELPGNSFFIDNDEILALPRDDGDCRYPYGSDGFNFWAYSSGYMHCNEGIFSPFMRVSEGQEPRIAFFAGVTDSEKNDETISLLSIPIMDSKASVDRFTVFTKSCVYYITKWNEIRFAIRVYVNEKKQINFSLIINNLSNRQEEIVLSSYFNPFLVHAISESGDNRWFRETRYNESDNSNELGYFIVKTNEDLNRTTSISNYGVIKRNIQCGEKSNLLRHEETTSRYQYVGGSRGSLHSPKAVKERTFGTAKHISTFTEVGALGDLITLQLGESDAIRLDITMEYLEYCQDDYKLNALINRRIDLEDIDKSLIKIEAKEKAKDELLKINVGKTNNLCLKENLFNPFIEHLKKQVEFCALTNGYVQAYVGSLIGIRDIFQAMEGLLLWQPEAVKRKMLEALDFTAPNGRCPRQYTLPAREGAHPEMDLRAFIDQGVWVISTIITYLKYTNDFSFLNEECGYYEIINEKNNIVKKSEKRDSVLEHMLKIMNFLIINRDHEITKCVRVLYGDWNDALDGLGVSDDPNQEFGTGVSVMASLQVYQNLIEMEELLKKFDGTKYIALLTEYKQVKHEIKEGLNKYAFVAGEDGSKRIVHGWGDKVSYYVGGFEDPDCKSRHGLTSNAFWVLSGMYDEDTSIKDTILGAFCSLDSKYGMKTFHPHFEPDIKGVGRIPKLPAGTAENGAAYIHASLFGVMAMFRMGHSEVAWNQLIKSLPFTHDYVSCSPFVMPNSYCYNEEKSIQGYSMADWQTGSSNVLLKLLVKYVFGLCPEYEGIWIQPANYLPFEDFSFEILFKKCNVVISYKPDKNSNRQFYINGKQRNGEYDQVMQLDKLWISNEELKCREIRIQVIG
jgi:cellobiose phosphorylase